MNAFTIKDLENLSGIKAHTIRIWEQRYSLLKPKRSQTNIRYYHSDELKTLLNIALLNKNGYKISHINRMTPEMMKQKIIMLSSVEAQHERVVNSMLNGMIDLESNKLEKIIDTYISENGIDRAISNIIFPFLHKIGILWMTDHIRVAQEHLVSNIIRQKLVKGIEEVKVAERESKPIVMFLPDGEYHELGLLYVYYLLKSKGTKIIYLGADVPVDELVYVCNLKQPGYLYTHLTSLPSRFNFEKYLALINQKIKETPLVISGRITHDYTKKIPQGVSFVKSLDEAIQRLAA